MQFHSIYEYKKLKTNCLTFNQTHFSSTKTNLRYVIQNPSKSSQISILCEYRITVAIQMESHISLETC